MANFLTINKTMDERELREEICPALNIFQLCHFVDIYVPDRYTLLRCGTNHQRPCE